MDKSAENRAGRQRCVDKGEKTVDRRRKTEKRPSRDVHTSPLGKFPERLHARADLATLGPL